MCDQDHFEQDREKAEALGLITRKQFGVTLAAGVAMLLPKVANAAAVTETDVNIKTSDGTCDAYFVHPSTGTAARRSRLARHLRSAAGIPPDG